MPSDVRYVAAKRMWEAKSYFYQRTSGSRHIFEKAGVGSFSIPVHNGKVKHVYIRQIKKLK